MARAPAVRFSICELEADSLRSRIDAKGAVSIPTSLSKRTKATAASSAAEATLWLTVGTSSDIDAGNAASYGPLIAARRPREMRSGLISLRHWRVSVFSAGHVSELSRI